MFNSLNPGGSNYKPPHLQPNTNILLQQMLEGIGQTNALLNTLVSRQTGSANSQWKEENKQFSERCNKASQVVSRLYQEFIDEMLHDLYQIEDGDEFESFESHFKVMEFIDKYGPRLQQLGLIVNTLNTLG